MHLRQAYFICVKDSAKKINSWPHGLVFKLNVKNALNSRLTIKPPLAINRQLIPVNSNIRGCCKLHCALNSTVAIFKFEI